MGVVFEELDLNGSGERIVILKLLQVEGEMSAQEWYDLRNAAYTSLRKKTHIPPELIDAVESIYDYRAKVTWVDSTGQPVDQNAISEEVCLVVHRQQPSTGQVVAAINKNNNNWQRRARWGPVLPGTADEAFAYCLRYELRRLRAATKAVRKGNSSKAPVRGRELIPRSLISDVALDMVENCQFDGHALGQNLTQLLKELLESDRPKKGSAQDYKARHEAAWILAQADIGVRQLADFVGVTPSTVSRWKQDRAFQDKIQHNFGETLLGRRGSPA